MIKQNTSMPMPAMQKMCADCNMNKAMEHKTSATTGKMASRKNGIKK